jgi:Pyridoxal phosphate biosynthetic protein PdxA
LVFRFTVGLSVVRTSVDHGTAFDIARRGKADRRLEHQALTLFCHMESGYPWAGGMFPKTLRVPASVEMLEIIAACFK